MGVPHAGGASRRDAVRPARVLNVAWDTTLASRIYPGNRYERHLLERAAEGEPIALTAPGISEISYGLSRAADRDASLQPGLAWFTRLAMSDLVVTLSLDAAAALAAGRVRARRPLPPTGTRRAGSRPEQLAGWVLDIQTASCAWAHGHAIATHNLQDFEAIRDVLARLYPTVPGLDVKRAPEL